MRMNKMAIPKVEVNLVEALSSLLFPVIARRTIYEPHENISDASMMGAGLFLLMTFKFAQAIANNPRVAVENVNGNGNRNRR